MANVRFYRLPALPVWNATKYKGIFVHIDGEFNPYTYENGKNAETITLNDVNYKAWKYGKETTGKGLNLYFTTYNRLTGEEEKLGEVVGRFTYRGELQVLTGLWFGGTNGWELLTNDTDVNYINTLITNKINELDVSDYAQAEITTGETDSSLTIKGIKEVDGKISVGNNNVNVSVEIDGVYSSSNKIATVSTVTNKINTLDVSTIPTLVKVTDSNNNTTLTLKGVKETDGKIEQGEGTETFTVGDGILKLSGKGATSAGNIPAAVTTDVFSANYTANSTITLGDEFVWDGTNKTIGLRVKTAVTGSNNLVTESDIASLAGAMHYKGTLTNAQSGKGSWPSTVTAGDVYIVTVAHTHGSDSLEVGDMVVFNSTTTTDYKVVQSNLTLGVAAGQVAENTDTLGDNKLVVGVNPASGSKGIKTVDFDVTNLTSTTGKNERTLTLSSRRADREVQGENNPFMQDVYHGVGITDTFKIMGRSMDKSFSISSPNRSISIEASGTDAQVDLIWNTVIDV